MLSISFGVSIPCWSSQSYRLIDSVRLINEADDDILFHAFTEEGFRKALQACTKLTRLHMNVSPDKTIISQQVQGLSFL